MNEGICITEKVGKIIITLASILIIGFILACAGPETTRNPYASKANPDFLAESSTSPLRKAAEVGDIQQVNALLEDGVDVNAKDRYGRTPLHLAAANGHIEVVRLLLDKGANINARTKMISSLQEEEERKQAPKYYK